MPELPEVETTATILNKLVKGHKIIDVWTDYNSPYFSGKENIKDPKYFLKFKKEIVNKKIIKVWRRAKNVLIDISGDKTILIHMKMTGHLLYGKYLFKKVSSSKKWVPENSNSPLADPFNRFVHLIFVLDNGKHIAFSDMRKFATVSLISDKKAFSEKFKKVGPEPLDKNFDWKTLKKIMLLRPEQKIKTALMDPYLIAGIGNIYSDEILWSAKINPERKNHTITDSEWKNVLKYTKSLLLKGISFGGDSMSDYRNPYGLRGEFQKHHSVYQRKNKNCLRKNCLGKIERKMINQRSAHFCPICQK
jgi:formamidopyrimidine-DNA glycosylase